MNRRGGWLLGGGLLVVLVVVFAWRMRATDTSSVHTSAPTAPASQPVTAIDPQQAAADSTSDRVSPVTTGAVSPEQRTPASLRDTDTDGRLAVDAQGQLIVDRELRRLFDYLLAGASEQPIGVLRQRLHDLAFGQGGGALATQALDAFDRYVAYLRAEDALARRQSDDLQARLDALIALRRQHLGAATAEAYFGEEERYAQATLEGAQDNDPAWREQRRAATEHQRALEQTAQFEQLGLDAAQRWEEREALYGAEAADRLAELDASQAAWDARMQDWAARRAALQADRSMTPEQHALAVEALFESMFDEAERRRIEALEGEGG